MTRPTLALACLVVASLFGALAAGAGVAPAPGELRVTMLPPTAGDAPASEVATGRRDGEFVRYSYRAARLGNAPFWLRLELAAPLAAAGLPALHVGRGRHLGLEFYAGGATPILPAASWSTFRGQ